VWLRQRAHASGPGAAWSLGERMVGSLACPGSLTHPVPSGTVIVVETAASGRADSAGVRPDRRLTIEAVLVCDASYLAAT
jgi:hypothetical protein